MPTLVKQIVVLEITCDLEKGPAPGDWPWAEIKDGCDDGSEIRVLATGATERV